MSMRADKAQSIAKVMKEVINNPLQSQRDIAEKTWLSLWNVNNKLNDIEHLSSEEKIIDFVALDLEIQTLASKEIIRRLKYNTETIDNSSLVRFNETSFKRSLVLSEKEKWDNQIQFIIS